jgi:penicillin-binding protein 1C
VAAALLALRYLPHESLLAETGFSRAVSDRHGKLLRLTRSPDGAFRRFVPLSEISPLLVEATLLHEDRRFFWHPGVDPLRLVEAAVSTWKGRREGGSTVTMQLARRLGRFSSRRPLGKLRQVFAALWIELRHSKREILEAYLNLCPYGGNIEGAAGASEVYFGTSPDKLTLPQALTLALLPQRPAARVATAASESGSPGSDGAAVEFTAELNRARHALLGRWLRSHPEDREQAVFADLALSPKGARHLPFQAPHFVDEVLRLQPQGDLATTLDLDRQKLVESAVQRYLAQVRPVGLDNAAVLLVDARDMGVRAAVGSGNYFDEALQGQESGLTAKRSPGSTVKPFIYALALQQGLIHPLSLLKDAPLDFAGYEPEDFDGQFMGPLSAHDALIHSRNVPAVRLAAQLRNPNLYDLLVLAGVRGLRPESHYGLAVALGGAEVTLEELAELYAMLADGGRIRPLRRLQSDPAAEGRPLITPQASYLVLDMLKDNLPPEEATGLGSTSSRLSIPWKTGTSNGFRDAWAIGIVGPYVLGVWLGHFDGRGDPALKGREAAAPLFFSIADALQSTEGTLPEPWRVAPNGLISAKLCAVSGQIPGPHCPHVVRGAFIAGVSPIETCEVHRAVEVDIATGRRACPGSGRPTRQEVYEFWPSDLLKIFAEARLPRRTPPPVDPSCPLDALATAGLPPQIVSPQRSVTYALASAESPAGGGSEIPFLASVDADVREVNWFLDESFLGRSHRGEALYWTPEPGRYLVRAVDDHGRAAAREIRVARVR